MPSDYFSAAVPEPFRILGLALKPLSLGRYRLMNRFDVAFVAGKERVPTIPDLLLGVLICSMRCDEFEKFLQDDGFQKQVRRWGKKVKPKHFNVLEKIRLFRHYIEIHSVVPKYWEMDDSGDTSGAHWSHSMEVALRGELGWSKEEIDEAPLSKAIADYFKWCETRGSIRLMTEEDLELVAALDKQGGENGP